MTKPTIIKSVNNLSSRSNDELSHFCEIFKSERYVIKNVSYQKEIELERTRDCFKDVKTYQEILKDSNASIQYFSMEFEIDSRAFILPLGVYGISEHNKFAFPLLLNDFWRDFLTVSKLDFATFLEITNEQDIDMYFLRLIELRKTFLHKIFNFYVSSNPILTTAMAWKIRGPKSLTRFTAESVGFFRYELDEYELYSSKEISKEQLEYLRDCLLRWFSQFANNCPENHVEPQPNRQAFARYLVER